MAGMVNPVSCPGRVVSRVLLIAGMFLILSACAAGVALTPTTTPTPSPFPVEDTPTPTAAATLTASPAASCPPLDGLTEERMRLIGSQVAQLRGLEPRQVPLAMVIRDELVERVESDLLAEYSEQEALQDTLLLRLLGLIEPELALRDLYRALLAEQVAGFYDSEAEEMVIVCEDAFGGVDQATFAHETVHVLQDMTYDLEGGLDYNDEACDAGGERCLALQALIEGDASLLQEQWLRTFGLEQVLPDLLAFFDEFEMPVFDSAPAYIQAELTFPYLEGLVFARSLYLAGGWAAVDAAYDNPPVSSEQILHPERYPRDLPVVFDPPRLAETLGEGWSEVLSDTLGEWGTRMTLEQYLDPSTALAAAEGWGGDFVLVYETATHAEGALILLTQWDTVRDAREFADAFGDYGAARFGDASESSASDTVWIAAGLSSRLVRTSNQTLWLLAPDEDTLALLSDSLTLPLRPSS
jgi:hypothetical protein